VNAFILPRISGDLPMHLITPKQSWSHLDGLQLADPDHDKPVGTFIEEIRHGRQCGRQNSELNTEFGWMLAGSAIPQTGLNLVTTHFISVLTDDLCRFWDVEGKTVASNFGGMFCS